MKTIKIRKAQIKDIKQIQQLVNSFAAQDLMLPRSLNNLYENLRDFWVAQAQSKKIIGCCALHVSWDELAEIRSLAVQKSKQRKGIGRQLVSACFKEAKSLGAKKVFVLTYIPDFFQKFGLGIIEHSKLPHKIWMDCINCAKFPNCKEVALEKEI